MAQRRDDWEKKKEYLIKCLFKDPPTLLSPIPESPSRSVSPILVQSEDSDEHLPDLIIERVKRKRSEESEEYWKHFEVRMHKLYRQTFLGHQVDTDESQSDRHSPDKRVKGGECDEGDRDTIGDRTPHQISDSMDDSQSDQSIQDFNNNTVRNDNNQMSDTDVSTVHIPSEDERRGSMTGVQEDTEAEEADSFAGSGKNEVTPRESTTSPAKSSSITGRGSEGTAYDELAIEEQQPQVGSQKEQEKTPSETFTQEDISKSGGQQKLSQTFTENILNRSQDSKHNSVETNIPNTSESETSDSNDIDFKLHLEKAVVHTHGENEEKEVEVMRKQITCTHNDSYKRQEHEDSDNHGLPIDISHRTHSIESTIHEFAPDVVSNAFSPILQTTTSPVEISPILGHKRTAVGISDITYVKKRRKITDQTELNSIGVQTFVVGNSNIGVQTDFTQRRDTGSLTEKPTAKDESTQTRGTYLEYLNIYDKVNFFFIF